MQNAPTDLTLGLAFTLAVLLFLVYRGSAARSHGNLTANTESKGGFMFEKAPRGTLQRYVDPLNVGGLVADLRDTTKAERKDPYACFERAYDHKVADNPMGLARLGAKIVRNDFAPDKCYLPDLVAYVKRGADKNELMHPSMNSCVKYLEEKKFCQKPGYIYGSSFDLAYCSQDQDLNTLFGQPCLGSL